MTKGFLCASFTNMWFKWLLRRSNRIPLIETGTGSLTVQEVVAVHEKVIADLRRDCWRIEKKLDNFLRAMGQDTKQAELTPDQHAAIAESVAPGKQPGEDGPGSEAENYAMQF